MESELFRETDAALIIAEDGTCELLIPGGEADDTVLDNVLFVTAIMMRLRGDPNFYHEQVEWFRTLMERKSTMVN